MSQTLKIVKYLGKDNNGNDEFVLSVPPQNQEWNGNPTEERIKVAHDYIEIFGGCNFELARGVDKPESQKKGASNWLNSMASIQISIRDVFSFILPHLNKHKYLQPEHFESREYSEDDKYWEQYQHLSGPRYKKGDKYPAYAYNGGIIHYNDPETGAAMVAFRRTGETVYSHVTNSSFQTIKEHLKLEYKDIREFNG